VLRSKGLEHGRNERHTAATTFHRVHSSVRRDSTAGDTSRNRYCLHENVMHFLYSARTMRALPLSFRKRTVARSSLIIVMSFRSDCHIPAFFGSRHPLPVAVAVLLHVVVRSHGVGVVLVLATVVLVVPIILLMIYLEPQS
jgi:hypothetical protein